MSIRGRASTSPLPVKRTVTLPILAFCAAALLIYLNFQSISLDDFDSVSFALALDHFNIALQQPHPPGFPVYVAVGRAVHGLITDPRAALTLVSAVSGAIAVATLAWLGVVMGHSRAGLLAGLWMLFLPAFWLSSEMALSDVPGLTLVLLAVACLWKGQRDSRWLIGGAFLAGLCLGLRPQNGIPVAIFGVYTVIRMIRDQGWRRATTQIGLAFLAGLTAVLLWLMPTVSASGGWNSYWSLVREHSAHVVQIDSLFGKPITGAALGARLITAGNGLMALVGGEPITAAFTVILLAVGLANTVITARCLPAVRLCAAWLVLVALQVFLLESLERPRLYLPFIPPLILLATMGLISPFGRQGISDSSGRNMLRSYTRLRISSVFGILLAGALAFAGLPLAITLTREPSPPVQAIDFITAHYPADQTLVVSFGSFRAAQIGLPTYPQLYLGQFDAVAWTQRIAARQPKTLVLLDRDDFWPEAYTALTENSQVGDYVPVEDYLFERDPRVFPQHSVVRMQVLTPIKLLSPSQLTLPASGEIRVADSESGKYLGEGWYRAEDIGGVMARWTQQTAVIRAVLPPVDTVLTIEVTPYATDQAVTVLVNGQPVGTLSLSGVWQQVRITIPARALAGYPISTISLRHAQAETPPGSSRSLAAAYRVIRFTQPLPDK